MLRVRQSLANDLQSRVRMANDHILIGAQKHMESARSNSLFKIAMRRESSNIGSVTTNDSAVSRST
jgi:hypothetical protein